MYIPGIPAHVVQRGHNRKACFFADNDYVLYKEVLAEALGPLRRVAPRLLSNEQSYSPATNTALRG